MSDTTVIEQPAAAAPAAPTPAAAPAASAPAAPAPAPSAPAAPAASLLSRGAAPTPAPAEGAPVSPIPAKFQVKREDGSVDEVASAAKMGEAYTQLEKRLGTGDAPPATPEDYKPTIPEGLTIETLKADPLYQGFLKGAHARGMTNQQVSYVLEALAERETARNSPELAEADLRATWPTDQQMQKGLADAFRATKAFGAVDQKRHERIEAKFANDPDFLWLMAQIGKELQEDTSVTGGLSSSEQSSLESLMASKAYHDSKDPQHAETVARVRSLYAKRYPS